MSNVNFKTTKDLLKEFDVPHEQMLFLIKELEFWRSKGSEPEPFKDKNLNALYKQLKSLAPNNLKKIESDLIRQTGGLESTVLKETEKLTEEELGALSKEVTEIEKTLSDIPSYPRKIRALKNGGRTIESAVDTLNHMKPGTLMLAFAAGATVLLGASYLLKSYKEKTAASHAEAIAQELANAQSQISI